MFVFVQHCVIHSNMFIIHHILYSFTKKNGKAEINMACLCHYLLCSNSLPLFSYLHANVWLSDVTSGPGWQVAEQQVDCGGALHNDRIRIDSRRQQSGHLNGKSIPGCWWLCLNVNKPLAHCLSLPLFCFLSFPHQLLLLSFVCAAPSSSSS